MNLHLSWENNQIGIVGAGVVGAAIAYELSQIPGLKITVLDQRSPQQWHATGAALGILVGGLSSKLRGQHLQLRLASLERYETLIPELVTQTGQPIPYNRQGILQLCFDAEAWERWHQIAAVRQEQGWTLKLLSLEQVTQQYAAFSQARSLSTGNLPLGAIYSPQDRQVHPIALTEALIQAAQQRGVRFCWEIRVEDFLTFESKGFTSPTETQVQAIKTDQGTMPVNWLILAAGLGSTALTQKLTAPVTVAPVLGQALLFRRRQPLEIPYPVVQAEDVHIVPLDPWQVWVGATVEFPPENQAWLNQLTIEPDPQLLQRLLQQAITLDPTLADAEVVDTWFGLRPRPQGRPAPIIEPLAGYQNVMLATGHYRNGILLAPITALKVRQWLEHQLQPT